MPKKTFSVMSYAAGVSLAAAALIYVFAPSYFVNGSSAVGLQNQANDCFINSVLQVLAGMDELRLHLIRETHRRSLDGPDLYATAAPLPKGAPALPVWKIKSQQLGEVTRGLKDILDALNERPISRKVITPSGFVRVLQTAFGQQISRQQQDAQEFLQIVLERLRDEFHAGQRARTQARLAGATVRATAVREGHAVGKKEQVTESTEPTRSHQEADTAPTTTKSTSSPVSAAGAHKDANGGREDGFPFEGKYESHIVCQTCRYQSTPKGEDFFMLTVSVPQVSATTLEACFDMIFKTEFIDDFRCEKCHLVYVRDRYERQLAKAASDRDRVRARQAVDKLTAAIETCPEKPPEGVDLGNIRDAPRRRIARSTRLVGFPKTLAIHLSRSIYDGYTLKNSAKVAFPERLPLGNLLDRREYRLVALVTHRGGHNSGHYESFRRQNAPAATANQNTLQPSGTYSRPASPTVSSTAADNTSSTAGPEISASSSKRASDSSIASADSGSLRSIAASARLAVRRSNGTKGGEGAVAGGEARPGGKARSKGRRGKKKGTPTDRWWRISDEKVREARTSEVLNMQRDVYLLFYELSGDRAHGDEDGINARA